MLKLVTGPVKEVITYQQFMNHSRINPLDEDIDLSSIEYAERLIKSVRKLFENSILSRALITQTWRLYLDSFPSVNFIDLPFPPLQNITHLKYTDSDHNTTTWDSTSYIENTIVEPGRLVLKYNGTWPTTTLYPVNPIEIEFIAGYGDNPEDVPEPIVNAMLLTIADLYENRETILTGTTSSKLDSVSSLISDYRIINF